MSRFDNREFKPGGSALSRFLWFYVNVLVFRSSLFPFYGLKSALLRLFGARVGVGAVIKPCVNIKYPWNLTLGDYVWIGESVWIDNLDQVQIDSHACVSQGALLLTGNHDFTKASFDLITKPIFIGAGAWVGAQALVCPGVTLGEHAVLTAKSNATKDLDPFGVYAGNPAVKVKDRIITN